MDALITIEQLKADLRLGSGTSEDPLLTRLRGAAIRRCAGHTGRKLDGDAIAALPVTDRELFASAVSILVGMLYRDRDEGQQLPRTVTWLLEDLRGEPGE